MRKFSLLLSIIAAFALVLTACGGQQTSTSLPSTNVPPVTVESTATEAPSATEAPATTATAGVPVTGEENPSRVSKMLDFKVYNQNGDQVGEVDDLVLDLNNTRVAYVAVNTSGDVGNKTVLIPWGSLQVQSQAGATGGQQNAFVLLADPNFLQNAPDTDLASTLPQMCQAAGNWDADIRSFWQSGAVPGAPSANSTSTSGTGAGTATEAPVVASTATSSSSGTGTETATPATGTSAGTGMGQGNATGQGDQLQGVVLASQVIGATINVGTGIGNGPGTGTGQATAMPNETATSTTGTSTGTETPSAISTATTGAGTGTGTGTGTGLGNMQATVKDLIVDTATGDVRYVVISTADQAENWIPVPLGMFRCDTANNGFMTTANANALQNAPFFTEDQFPDTSTTGWDQQWSDFWSTNGGNGTGTGTGSGTGTGTGIATATP